MDISGTAEVWVLDNPGIQNFRDPKVGWYQETGHWFMVLAVERSIHVYTSRDLRSWKQKRYHHHGRGTPRGSTGMSGPFSASGYK